MTITSDTAIENLAFDLFDLMEDGDYDNPVFLTELGNANDIAIVAAQKLGNYDAMKKCADLLVDLVHMTRMCHPERFDLVWSGFKELDLAWDGIHGWKC